MSARAHSLAAAVTAAFSSGFEAQAEQFGAELHREAVEARANHPATRFWLATFDQQAKNRAKRALAEIEAGNQTLGRALYQAATMAAENARRVRAAVLGE